MRMAKMVLKGFRERPKLGSNRRRSASGWCTRNSGGSDARPERGVTGRGGKTSREGGGKMRPEKIWPEKKVGNSINQYDQSNKWLRQQKT